MKNLKRLGLSFTLMAFLATGVLAGETGSPPCVPGELSSPPCVAQSVNDQSTAPGETNSPPALTAVDLTDIAETVLWSLLLF